MKPVEKLFSLIPSLDAVEFAGLARLMGIQLLEETNPEAEKIKDRFVPRGFLSVLNEMLEKYDKMNRTRKREILSLVKDATKRARGPLMAEQLEALSKGKEASAPKTEGE